MRLCPSKKPPSKDLWSHLGDPHPPRKPPHHHCRAGPSQRSGDHTVKKTEPFLPQAGPSLSLRRPSPSSPTLPWAKMTFEAKVGWGHAWLARWETTERKQPPPSMLMALRTHCMWLWPTLKAMKTPAASRKGQCSKSGRRTAVAGGSVRSSAGRLPGKAGFLPTTSGRNPSFPLPRPPHYPETPLSLPACPTYLIRILIYQSPQYFKEGSHLGAVASSLRGWRILGAEMSFILASDSPEGSRATAFAR